MRMSGSILAACALLGLSVSVFAQSADAPAASAANPRIALVIGEETYPDQTLATSANDAGLVAQVLQAAGFDVVGARDLDQKSIRTALRDFLNRADAAGPNMQAFVYLSGRAVQFEGDNFLVPIDAQIARDSDVPIEGVRLTDFTHALAAAPGFARIVVLDGARANPYAKTGAPLVSGLALADAEAGELLAFNASPGSIAGDEPGPYGLYAKTLAGTMRQGGVAIEDVFAQTRLAVNEASGGAQLPWSASKLGAPYFIFERAADAPAPAAPAALAATSRRPIKSFPKEDAYAAAVQRDTLAGYQEYLSAYPDAAQARRVRAILAARREALFWRRSLEQNSPHAYWTYLKRYPRGPHAAEADGRLARLAARIEPPADFEPEDYSDLPPPPRDELVYADRPTYIFSGPDYGPPPPPPPPGYGFVEEDDDWRDLPPPPPPTVYGVLPALAVALPLLLTARAYHDAGRRDGNAQQGAPPPRAIPVAPPPLPPGVHVEQAPPGGNPRKPLPASPNPGLPPAPNAGSNPAATPLAKTPQPLPSPTPMPGATPPVRKDDGGAIKPAPLSKTPLPLPPPAPAPGATPNPVPKDNGQAGKPAPLSKTPQPLPPPTPEPGAAPNPAPKDDGRAGKPAPLPKTPQPLPTPTLAPGATPNPAPKDDGRAGKPAPLSKTPQPLAPGAAPNPTPQDGGAAAKPAPLPKTPHPLPSTAPAAGAPPNPIPKDDGAAAKPTPLSKTPQPLASPTASPSPLPKRTLKDDGEAMRPAHKDDGAAAKPAPLSKTPSLPPPTMGVSPKPASKDDGAAIRPAPLAKTPSSASAPAPLPKAAPAEPSTASKPAPPVVHSAPHAVEKPAPVVRAPPPPAPAPVVRAPPPPAPAPVAHAPPPPPPAPAPVAHAPPPPHAPAASAAIPAAGATPAPK